jgi:hypothetical protein
MLRTKSEKGKQRKTAKSDKTQWKSPQMSGKRYQVRWTQKSKNPLAKKRMPFVRALIHKVALESRVARALQNEVPKPKSVLSEMLGPEGEWIATLYDTPELRQKVPTKHQIEEVMERSQAVCKLSESGLSSVPGRLTAAQCVAPLIDASDGQCEKSALAMALFDRFRHLEPGQAGQPEQAFHEGSTFIADRARWKQLSCTRGRAGPPRRIKLTLEKEFTQLVAVKIPWTPKKSVWKSRRKQCESKGYVDSEEVFRNAFDSDWAQLSGRKKLTEMLESVLGKSCTAEDMQLLGEAVFKEFHMLSDVHDFYTGLSGGGSGLKPSGFGQFLDDVRLVDEKSQVLSQGSFDAMFTAVQDKQPGGGNTNALKRHEWLEFIVRTAILKYMHHVSEPRKTVELLCMEIRGGLRKNVPIALFDRNRWRKERLYTEKLDKTLKAHLDELRGVFDKGCRKMKKAEPEQRRLLYIEWERLVCKLGVVDKEFTKREARNCFCWSKMFTSDNKIQSYEEMTFLEFIDGLCLMGEMKAWPTKKQMKAEHIKSAHAYIKLAAKSKKSPGPSGKPLPLDVEDHYRKPFGHIQSRSLADRMSVALGCALEPK